MLLTLRLSACRVPLLSMQSSVLLCISTILDSGNRAHRSRTWRPTTLLTVVVLFRLLKNDGDERRLRQLHLSVYPYHARVRCALLLSTPRPSNRRARTSLTLTRRLPQDGPPGALPPQAGVDAALALVQKSGNRARAAVRCVFSLATLPCARCDSPLRAQRTLPCS